MLHNILKNLEGGDADVLYARAADQTLLNYMTMKSGLFIYNLALNKDINQRTGNCVISTHFKEKDHILYNKGTRLMYLHYIGIPVDEVRRVCSGENINFPYRDIFLYYRFLKEPEKCPVFKNATKK